ncbi:MAG: SLC13 family permease [Rubrivivax sp.]|nr:SLC13 family permease [Rubrivivax sp.]
MTGLGPHGWACIAFAVAVFAAFIWDRLPIATVCLAVLALLPLGFAVFPLQGADGPVDPTRFYLGFGNPALVAICSLMVVGQGLVVTGALAPAARRLAAIAARSPRLALLAVLVAAGAASGVVNDTPVVVLLIPLLLAAGSHAKAGAGGLLLPMNYAVLIGGMATTIGTSTNLIVVALAAAHGLPALGMFSFTGMVAVAAVPALLYLWLLAPWLLRHVTGEPELLSEEVFDAELTVPEGGWLDGRQLREALAAAGRQLELVDIRRGGRGLARLPSLQLRAGDRLLLRATAPRLKELEQLLHTPLHDVETGEDVAGSKDTPEPGTADAARGEAHRVEQAPPAAQAALAAPAAKVTEPGQAERAGTAPAAARAGECGTGAEAGGAGEDDHAGSARSAEKAEKVKQAERAKDDDATGRGKERRPAGVVAQLVVEASSPLVGRSVRLERIAERFGIVVVGLRPRKVVTGWQRSDLADRTILPGDVLLVQGSENALRLAQREGVGLLLDQRFVAPRQHDAPLALAVLAGVVVLAATKLLPIALAGMLGAAVLVLSGVLSWKDVVRSLSAKVVLLLAASLALGDALGVSGATAWMGSGLGHLLAGLSPAWVAALLMALMGLVTNFVSNNAAAAIGTPLAISLAQALGAPPEQMVLAVLFGCNLCYLTPMGYQTNLLVMNAAGYRFGDFLRVGAPLFVIMWGGLSIALAGRYG